MCKRAARAVPKPQGHLQTVITGVVEENLALIEPSATAFDANPAQRSYGSAEAQPWIFVFIVSVVPLGGVYHATAAETDNDVPQCACPTQCCAMAAIEKKSAKESPGHEPIGRSDTDAQTTAALRHGTTRGALARKEHRRKSLHAAQQARVTSECRTGSHRCTDSYDRRRDRGRNGVLRTNSRGRPRPFPFSTARHQLQAHCHAFIRLRADLICPRLGIDVPGRKFAVDDHRRPRRQILRRRHAAGIFLARRALQTRSISSHMGLST
jgi:hypothetical protein